MRDDLEDAIRLMDYATARLRETNPHAEAASFIYRQVFHWMTEVLGHLMALVPAEAATTLGIQAIDLLHEEMRVRDAREETKAVVARQDTWRAAGRARNERGD